MFQTYEHADPKNLKDDILHTMVAEASEHYKNTGKPATVEIPEGTYNFDELRITCPMILVGQGRKRKDTKLYGSISIGNNNLMVSYQENGGTYERFEGIPEPGVRLENMQITNKTGTYGPAVSVSDSVCVLKDVRITNCKDDGLVASSVDDDPTRSFIFKTTQAVVRCDKVIVTQCQGSGIVANGTALIVLGPGTKVTKNCQKGYQFDFGLKVDTYYKAAIHIKKPLTLKGVSHDNGVREAKNVGRGYYGGTLKNIKEV